MPAPWQLHSGLVVPLARPNVDTDQIVPKQFLQTTGRGNFAAALFFDWRGPDFILDRPAFAGASILLAGENFGCGSSREHAAWALCDFGFRAVLAPSFADIFAANAARNGLLCIPVPAATLALWATESAAAAANFHLTIDLEAQTVTPPSGPPLSFSIPPFHRRCLLEGLDPIALALRHAPSIAAFESAR